MKKIFILLVFFQLSQLSVYSQTGDSDCAYPYIFVHGWGGNSDSWQAFYNSDFFSSSFGVMEPNGQVYHAVLNATSSTSLFGDPGGPFAGEDSGIYYDDDVILHHHFSNTVELEDKCIYAINFENYWNEDSSNPQVIMGSEGVPGGVAYESRSNQSSARKQGYALGKMIKEVLEVTQKEKVILVAHSMGGLACREYLQRSEFDENNAIVKRSWWVDPTDLINGHKVAKLMTVGTPHGGSISGIGQPVALGNKLGLDFKSEAVRDLRTEYVNNTDGIYLYGGNETDIPDGKYKTKDVNCDGEVNSVIGINQSRSNHIANSDMPLPTEGIKYNYYVSNQLKLIDDLFPIPTLFTNKESDGIVTGINQYLFESNNGNNVIHPITTSSFFASDIIFTPNKVRHTPSLPSFYYPKSLSELDDINQLIRGIDEGDFPYYAYPIELDNLYFGITQKRADFVANGSNIPFNNSQSSNNPNIDSDWYSINIDNGVSQTYAISIVKPSNKIYKVDIFDNISNLYSNPLDGNILSEISTPTDGEVINFDLGLLQSGSYYIRITAAVSNVESNFNSYKIKLHPSNEIVLGPGNQHKPTFDSPLEAGLIRIVQDGEPIFNAGDTSWTINLKAYNGFFEHIQLYETIYPNCGFTEGGFIDEIKPRKADITSIYKTINANTDLFGEFDSYSQFLTVNAKFHENTGLYLKFSDATQGEILASIFMPFVEPVLSSFFSNGFKLTDRHATKITKNVYLSLAKLKDNSQFSSIAYALIKPKNVIALRDAIFGELSSNIKESIVSSIRETAVSDAGLREILVEDLGDDWRIGIEGVITSLFEDLVISSGSQAIKMTSAVTESLLGTFDLLNNQELRYCLPIEFEDTKPEIAILSPLNGSEIDVSSPIFEWQGLDPDQDELKFDLYIKSPGDSDFTLVSTDLNQSTYDQFNLSEPGYYEWYVKARYSFNSTISVSSNIFTFSYDCSSASFSVSDVDYSIGTNNDEDLYDLILTYNGSFPTSTYSIDYIIEEEIYTVPGSDINISTSESELTLFISSLPKSKNATFILNNGCNNDIREFKPFPKLTYKEDKDLCLVYYYLEDESTTDFNIKINQVDVSLQNIGDTYIQYFDGTGLNSIDIEYSLVGSQVSYRTVESTTCVTKNYSCPLLDVEYTFDENENVTINLNTNTEDQIYYWHSNDGEKYIIRSDNAQMKMSELSTDQYNFYGLGSPKINMVVESPAAQGCHIQEIRPSDIPLAHLFMSDDMIQNDEVILYAINCNYTPLFLNPNSSRNLSNTSEDLPSALFNPMEDVYIFHRYESAIVGKREEIYGPLASNENFAELENLTHHSIESLSAINENDSLLIINSMIEFDFGEYDISRFINRWNKSISCWELGVVEPNDIFTDIIIKSNIEYQDSVKNEALQVASDRGVFISEMYQSAIQAINDYSLEDDPNENAVCASVSINLSQTLTMTREAFEGTLTIFNGSTDGAMDSVELDLVILDSDGVVSNDLFEIETTGTDKLTAIDGTGMLDADTEGSATVLFIPEPGAAPTVPRPYSFGGNLLYIDPFSGLRVTMPLVPVTLTVNPSPDMFLHYFLERDVLGDDIFTSEVEPSIPAKLGLMIENNGYGEATNVRIESAQPQVVDNENGLALNMNLIGTRLQGEEATMGLTNINFGNINPLSTKVGEWLFTSNLLGHFTGYETNLVHSDSRGNPDLSLISGIELHELIQSINVYGGLDDGIEDFLVNEVPDANDHPDAIYLTQGNTVYDVAESFTGEFVGDIVYPDFTNTLSFDPVDSLWNYIKLDDPGQGNYEIVSVTRDGDGFQLPLTNTWLTYVTIPDSRVQVYENKFHIADDVLAEGTQTYTVVWSPKDPNPPAVDTIAGAPTSLAYVPVTSLDIVFSEEINDSTFTYEDISLVRAGGSDLIDSTISIVKIDSVSYTVDISALTLEDGLYVFTAQAAGVTDLTGSPGLVGKQVSWTQTLASPAIISFNPDVDGEVISGLDSLIITFNTSIDTATFDIADISILHDDMTADLSAISLSVLDEQLQVFKLTNLSSIVDTIGEYSINFDLPNISSTINKQGASIQTIAFTYDNVPPEILSLIKIYDGGLDHQHVTGMRLVFSEEIAELTTAALKLLQNGVDINVLPVNTALAQNNSYDIYWTAIKSYPDANYEFSIDMIMIEDLGGNIGSGISNKIWLVDRVPSLLIDNLSISPDYGFSDTDALTYNRTFDLSFSINEYAQDVVIYQNDNGELVPLLEIEEIESGVHSYDLTLLTGGNTGIKITAKDSLLNNVEAEISVNIDETPLTGEWDFTSGIQVLVHPDSLLFTFTRPVLDTENIPLGSVSLTKDNVPVDISNLSLNFVNNNVIKVSGLGNLEPQYGNYVFSIDLSEYQKNSSGIGGYSSKETSYLLYDPNRAPLAIASQDTVVLTGDIVTVSAVDSYDPDGDELTYLWYAPEIVSLSDSTSVNPSFQVTNDMAGEVITLLLSVSDGSKVSTDIVRVYVSADDVLVSAKVLLQGPYDESTGEMQDFLRIQSKIPSSGPYTDTQRYKFSEEKSVDQLVLYTDNGNNIVDWVYIELVEMTNDSSVAGGMYLLRQEGEIVDIDGVSPPKFSNIPDGAYSLAIYHRNHLPIRTNDNLIIQTNSIENIDLTQSVDQILGTINAVHELEGTYTMIAGDIDGNGQIQQSDINLTRPKLGLSGYLIEDVDMNGEIQNTDIQIKILPNLGRGKQF